MTITEPIEIDVSILNLDLENPRLGQVENQSEALEAIINLDVKHFKTMMRSINDHGLDPGDSFYVIDDSDEGYTVVDGNRRLAALQVLKQPSKLQGTNLSDTIKRQLKKISDESDISEIEEISCVLFDSRSDADEWILRRHGRGLAGEERIHWGTLEIQKFQKDKTIIDMIDFVERNSTFSDDEWRIIRESVESKSSILKRFVDSKVGKEWLAISIIEEEGEKHPAFSRDPNLVLDILSKIFADIKDGAIDTRSYNKASDITEYFDELPKAMKPKGKPLSKAHPFQSTEIRDTKKRPRAAVSATAKKKSKTKTTATKALRRNLSPNRHVFAQPRYSKGQQLLREATKMSLKETPLSCAFVLRAFLQHTLDMYMTKNSLPFWEGTKQLELNTKAERVLKHLVENRVATASDLRGVKQMLTERGPNSIQSLNDFHHDRFQVPTADNMRTAWDTAEALFVAIHGQP